MGTAVEVADPKPLGVNNAIIKQEGSNFTLQLEVEYKDRGFHAGHLHLKVVGGDKPNLLFKIEANAMGAYDGRPPSVHENLKVLRSLSMEEISPNSEGAEWKRGEKEIEPDQSPS